MTHPETYVMTREEWSAVNRALASGSLANAGVMNRDRQSRRQIIEDAVTIMMAVYDRAAVAEKNRAA
jgi:hypothetical protein